MRILFLLTLLAAAPAAFAQSTYYVSPTGSNLAAGTITAPLATIPAALNRAAPGDTVYVRGGLYRTTASVRLERSGAEGARIHIWAYPGETPVFDFTGAPRGFDIRANYLHIKGLISEKSNDKGFLVTAGASHNILELVVAREHRNSGIQVENNAAYNLILNADSHHNYDPQNNGENADGFAVKFGVGPGNVLRGCRAWANSDDGYDFWSREHPNHQGVLVEDSWAFDNGYNLWDDPDFQGDSNGFKLGHGPGAHVLIRNVAWGHLAYGFDVNGNTSGVTLYNNTGFLNRNNFFFDNDRSVAQGVSILRNNLSFGDVRMDAGVTDHAFNTWNSGMPRARAADFVSTSPEGADGPRQADGSLPDIPFLRLVAGSPLIDAGTDVGLPFVGAAPDLGAFEFAGGGTSREGDPVAARLLALAGPNPFRGQTRLALELAAPEAVRLDVYDAVGRHVMTLAEGEWPAGRHVLGWDAAGLAPGLYLVRAQAGALRHALALTLTR